MKVGSERLIRLEEQLKRLREKVESLTKAINTLSTKGFYLLVIGWILFLVVLGYKEAIKIGFLGVM